MLTYSFQDSPKCLHLEGDSKHIPIESREVYDRPKAPGGLGYHKDPVAETRRRRSVLHCSLVQQGQDLFPQCKVSSWKKKVL